MELTRTLLGLLCFSVLRFTNQQEISDATPEEKCALAQGSCSSCIQAHPLCTWCSETTNLTIQGSRQIRCRTLSENENSCHTQFIENPKSDFNAPRNDSFSEITDTDNLANLTVIQLRPQVLDIKLRNGQPEKINLVFRRVIDYPLDLYYVMDLSFSMNDDLETLQELGSDLVDGIRNITNNVRLGFGTFVDKVMLPFASTVPEQLKNPCLNTENEQCAAVFGFRHQLPITADGPAFIAAVRSTAISGNIDSPEGGFDALMQIAVCQEIDWRPEALRVILFTSDASPHIAMDGKLAAILDINDMECHLEENAHQFYSNATVYALSKILDYPSVGQLKKVFSDQKIQPVFAVTEDVFPLYRNLANLLNPAYAYVLDSDSRNVIDLISISYDQIRSQVQLNAPTLPDEISMNYRVLCPSEETWKENSLECNNVFIGDEVIFQFELTSLECPTDRSSDVIQINSNSIQDNVTMNIEYLCDCECAPMREPNSSQCSNQGSLECGVCACNRGIRGMQCQCSESTTDRPLEQNCTSEVYIPGVTLCSGNGFCECGKCQCNEGYYEEYCQCRNTGCNPYNGLICGGPTQGVCENCNENPRCNCIGNWTLGEGVCKCNENLCRSPETSEICSNQGECDCNQCQCEEIFAGQFCQNCIHPRCVGFEGTCSGQEIRQCAVCVYETGIQNQEIATVCREECLGMGIVFRPVDAFLNCQNCLNGIQEEICATCDTFSRDPSVHTQQNCETETTPFDSSICILQYRIIWDKNDNQYVVYVKNFEESDCPRIDPLTIVLPVVGGILVIGIIALIIWKVIQTIRDKHEYQRFIQETQKAKWSTNENQLYVDPSAKTMNPMYLGN